MALTYKNCSEKIVDSEFRMAVKIELARTAMAWLNDDKSAVNYDIKTAWAKNALQNLDNVAEGLYTIIAANLTDDNTSVSNTVIAVCTTLATK